METVKNILISYEAASGQKVNRDKSDISFSKGVPWTRREELGQLLGVRQVSNPGKYLGIPSTVGKNKREIFQLLEDRVRKKTKDWKRRYLSGAGNTILIKSVAQAIPTYLMSCFLLPDQTIQRLNAISARFLWGQKNDERRMHWRSWKDLCRRKDEGGLGFRDMGCFNRAMLAKQAWRLIQNPESLLGCSLKARYFPRTSITHATVGYNPSFSWRSLVAGIDILREKLVWSVGDGQSIIIGRDRWLTSAPSCKITSRLSEDDGNKRVAELLQPEGNVWDDHKIKHLFNEADSKLIMDIPKCRYPQSDQLYWPLTPTGIYTVRSDYHAAREIQLELEGSTSTDKTKLWKWLWKLPIIPKAKLLMWRCLQDALPTKVALRRRGMNIDVVYICCGEAEETVEHVLRDCGWARFLWAASPLRIRTEEDAGISFTAWVSKILEVDSKDYHRLFGTFLWTVWLARNLRVFQNKELSHVQCFEIAMRHLPNSNREQQRENCRPSNEQK